MTEHFQFPKSIKEIRVPKNVIPMWQTVRLEIHRFYNVNAYGACVYQNRNQKCQVPSQACIR